MTEGSCYPYIEGMTVHDYYSLPAKSENLSCSVYGCEFIGMDKCEKKLCRWTFCKEHRNHKHHVCSAFMDGDICDDYGTYAIATHPDHTVCGYHKALYERKYYSQKLCIMCKKKQQKEYCSGCCDACFAIQYWRKEQGYTSLFGKKE